MPVLGPPLIFGTVVRRRVWRPVSRPLADTSPLFTFFWQRPRNLIFNWWIRLIRKRFSWTTGFFHGLEPFVLSTYCSSKECDVLKLGISTWFSFLHGLWFLIDESECDVLTLGILTWFYFLQRLWFLINESPHLLKVRKNRNEVPMISDRLCGHFCKVLVQQCLYTSVLKIRENYFFLKVKFCYFSFPFFVGLRPCTKKYEAK